MGYLLKMPNPNPKKDKIYAELVISGLLTYVNWPSNAVNRPIIENFMENSHWWTLKDGNGFRFKVSPDIIINVINACTKIPDFKKLQNKNLTVFTKCYSQELYDNIRDSISTLRKYNLIKEKQERKKGYSDQVRDFIIHLPNRTDNENQLKAYLQTLFYQGKVWDLAANEYKQNSTKPKTKPVNSEAIETIDPNLEIIQTSISQAMIQIAQKLPSELTAYTLECRNYLTAIIPILEKVLTLPSLVLPQDYIKLVLSSARIYVANGDYERAKSLLEDILNLDDKSIAIIDSQHLLGNIYFQQGQYLQAEKYYFQSYQLRIKILGEQHPDVADSSEAIARLYNNWGKLETAEKWYLETHNLQKTIHGTNHVLFAHTLNGLANLYIKTHKFEEAELHYNQALQILAKQSDPYPYLTDSQHGLANLYVRKKEYQKAEKLHQYAIDLIESKEGLTHHRLITHWASLAVIYCFQGKIKKAIELYRKCINKSTVIYGKEHPLVGTYRSDLAWIFSKSPNYQRRALILFNSSIAILTKTCTENHPSLINAKKGLYNLLEKINNSNQK